MNANVRKTTRIAMNRSDPDPGGPGSSNWEVGDSSDILESKNDPRSHMLKTKSFSPSL